MFIEINLVDVDLDLVLLLWAVPTLNNIDPTYFNFAAYLNPAVM